MKKLLALLMAAVMLTATACGGAEKSGTDTIPYWSEDSEVMQSIVSYVESVTDETSNTYLLPEDRIAVFDFDGTLYGERFPTYFDTCLMLHRALHDKTYEAPEEIKEKAAALEEALLNYQPEPEKTLSTSQCSAEMFKGMINEDYKDYIAKLKEEHVYGFNGMTYSDAFFQPMTALVKYLADNDFVIFICSGSERTIVRELIKGKLDKWIPGHQVMGSTYSFVATNQGDTDGRKYTISEKDELHIEGYVLTKNQKTNKVITIATEIGKGPALVFGNSSGDLAMGMYAIKAGGKGYMLLCDDTERDYGDPQVAAEFAKECEKIGLETISMKNDFTTIYGTNVKKVDELSKKAEEEQAAQEQAAQEQAAEGQTAAEEPAEEQPAEEQPAEEEPAEEEELQPAA